MCFITFICIFNVIIGFILFPGTYENNPGVLGTLKASRAKKRLLKNGDTFHFFELCKNLKEFKVASI